MDEVKKYDNRQYKQEFEQSTQEVPEFTSLLIQRTVSKKSSGVDIVSGHAIVEQIDSLNRIFWVRLLNDNYLLQSFKATSCLQQIDIGDTVLVNGDLNSKIYILAILEKKQSLPTIIETEQFILKAKSAQLILEGDLHLKAKKANVESSQWCVFAQNYQVESVSYSVEAVNSYYSSEKVERVSDISFETVRNATRMVSGIDKLISFNMDYSAEAFAKISAHTTMINGYQLLKTDGKLMMAG